MITDNVLRKEVRGLKAFYNVKYKTISEELGIRQNSLYSWLKNDFDLSTTNKRKLELIIKRYKEWFYYVYY